MWKRTFGVSERPRGSSPDDGLESAQRDRGGLARSCPLRRPGPGFGVDASARPPSRSLPLRTTSERADWLVPASASLGRSNSPRDRVADAPSSSNTSVAGAQPARSVLHVSGSAPDGSGALLLGHVMNPLVHRE